MRKTKKCVIGAVAISQSAVSLAEMAEKIGNISYDDFIETLKNATEIEALKIFQEDEKEFKPIYQKRHKKRCKNERRKR